MNLFSAKPAVAAWVMRMLVSTVMSMSVLLCCQAWATATGPVAATGNVSGQTASSEPFMLSPPKGDGPVVVRARFDLQDIDGIDDEMETFEFTGVLTLTWRDPRQAFDPAIAGINEKVFTGNYQVDEISPGWYPQVVLVNEAGLFQQSGVILRVKPDGTSTLVKALNVAASSKTDLTVYPLDHQRLEAVFQVLGFDKDEVLLQAATDGPVKLAREVEVPQWNLAEVRTSVRELPAAHVGSRGISSSFVLSVDVERKSFYVVRQVVLPLVIIVLLSFSVFWMDRSSLGDRVSVSFIGILTSVTYQLVMSDHLPRIAYYTLIHGFLNLSFLILCATVVVNLVVGSLDTRQKEALGYRIDFHCRWAFPFVYFGLLLVMLGVAILYY